MSLKMLDELPKIKITILTHTGVYPYDVNGPAIFLYNLFKGLITHFDTKIIYLTRKRMIMKYIINPIYEPLKAFKRLMESKVLIFNSPPIGLFSLILLLGWIARKRIIFIVHGGIFIEPKGICAIMWRSFLVKAIKITKSIVVTPSHHMAKILMQFFGIKSIVIHNGVDMKYIENIPQSYFSTKNNLIFVGHIRAIKGIHVLIKAIENLHRMGALCNLYLVGTGELEESLKDYVRKRRLSNIIHFLGSLNNKQTLSLVKAADIFILPSYWETFPLSLLEAMACGKPVVATNVGGISEIVKDRYNGILIPKGDHVALAKAIRFLLENSAYTKKLGEKAKKTIDKKFSLNIMIRKYLCLLTRVI